MASSEFQGQNSVVIFCIPGVISSAAVKDSAPGKKNAANLAPALASALASPPAAIYFLNGKPVSVEALIL
jgi:hypothetical protein